MDILKPYDKADEARLVNELDKKETERAEIAKRIEDMMESKDAAWSSEDHLKFKELEAKHSWLRQNIVDLNAEKDAVLATKPMDEKTAKAAKESPLNRWMNDKRDGLSHEERIEQEQMLDDMGVQGNRALRYVDPIFRTIANPGNAANSKTLDETTVQTVIDGLTDYGGALDCMTVAFTENGNAINYPIYDDGDEPGVMVTGDRNAQEIAAQGETTLSAFEHVTLNAWVGQTKFLNVSRYFNEDVQWDVGQFIRRLLMRRVGRLIERQITRGNAATGPTGLVTRAGSKNKTTAAAAFKFTDLNDLIYDIDRAYLMGEMGLYGFPHRAGKVGWMSTWKFKGALANMVDDDNRPILIPNVADGRFDMLLGYPLFINQEIPDTDFSAANKKPIYFGNWGAMTVRFAGAGLMIEEHYDSATAKTNSYQYMGRIRFDSECVGPLSAYDGTGRSPAFKALNRG